MGMGMGMGIWWMGNGNELPGTCTCPTGQITNDRRGMDAAIGWPKMKSLTPKIINEVGPINRRRLHTKKKSRRGLWNAWDEPKGAQKMERRRGGAGSVGSWFRSIQGSVESFRNPSRELRSGCTTLHPLPLPAPAAVAAPTKMANEPQPINLLNWSMRWPMLEK